MCFAIIVMTFLIGCESTHKQANMEVMRYNNVGFSSKTHSACGALKIGMSEVDVISLMEGKLIKSDDNYQGKYPFTELLPYTNKSVVSTWVSEERKSNGWPVILFIIFDSPRKSKLADAFLFDDGVFQPLVEGAYNNNIHKVKIGDSMLDVYRLCGKQNGDYFQDSDRKWRVRFIYWAFGGKMFIIEANAADGKVTYAKDGTL